MEVKNCAGRDFYAIGQDLNWCKPGEDVCQPQHNFKFYSDIQTLFVMQARLYVVTVSGSLVLVDLEDTDQPWLHKCEIVKTIDAE